MNPIEVVGVQIEASTGRSVVLLRELRSPQRLLPIFVGGSEALAIAMGLQEVEEDFPLVHDLLVDVLDTTDTRLDHVTLSAGRGGAYVAELNLEGSAGAHVLSSRTSDALALAVRMDAPIFAADDVLEGAVAIAAVEVDLDVDAAAEGSEGQGEADRSALIEDFRAFLDQVDPADFS